MSARRKAADPGVPGRDEPEHANEVRLVGRLAAEPEVRELPSGDTVWTFRLVVGRPRAEVRGRQSVDTLDCAAWTPRVQRSVAAWSAGDVVEVSGSMRRRFFRASGATASRVEVEVTRGRISRRAASG
ncbi:single-stranded DNA-binding protein [Nocardioides sp. SYSU D00038]|uniref:single-stranded DNA-binding protein n=1 Tax=Nocardioides sp. SYSU D00038 TaxID=2812554 RepID=UPI0019681FEF|nr:single-stranded DNA-binding protein [Nocardioides sp. SYSU D00038]